jgi:hypothetical protein
MSYLSTFEKRRRISLEKFFSIRNTMRKYYGNRLATEVANAPDKGLNSIDDEFAPWFWMAFGDSKSDVLSAICDTGGGSKCDNLDTNNIWRSSVSGDALFMRRTIVNMMNGDYSLVVDGFGNKVNLFPLMSQCSNDDIDTCTTTAPAVAQEEYYNIMRPPYTSALYIDVFSDKTETAPDYGRIYISY